jgi:hypothetical protein
MGFVVAMLHLECDMVWKYCFTGRVQYFMFDLLFVPLIFRCSRRFRVFMGAMTAMHPTSIEDSSFLYVFSILLVQGRDPQRWTWAVSKHRWRIIEIFQISQIIIAMMIIMNISCKK